jgi:hypothetical protein
MATSRRPAARDPIYDAGPQDGVGHDENQAEAGAIFPIAAWRRQDDSEAPVT